MLNSVISLLCGWALIWLCTRSFVSAMNWSQTKCLLTLLQSSRMELPPRFIVYIMSLLQWCQPLLMAHRSLVLECWSFRHPGLIDLGLEEMWGKLSASSNTFRTRFHDCLISKQYISMCHKPSNIDREFAGKMKMVQKNYYSLITSKKSKTTYYFTLYCCIFK